VTKITKKMLTIINIAAALAVCWQRRNNYPRFFIHVLRQGHVVLRNNLSFLIVPSSSSSSSSSAFSASSSAAATLLVAAAAAATERTYVQYIGWLF
jgi:hypothetical protein